MKKNIIDLADAVIHGKKISDEEGANILSATGSELTTYMAGAQHIRERFFQIMSICVQSPMQSRDTAVKIVVFALSLSIMIPVLPFTRLKMLKNCLKRRCLPIETGTPVTVSSPVVLELSLVKNLSR